MPLSLTWAEVRARRLARHALLERAPAARLVDGQRVATRQVGDAVVARVGAWAQEEAAPAWGGAWPRWRRAVGWAAIAGVLCFGPNAGSEVTFVRPDQWLGTWRDVDPREAL